MAFAIAALFATVGYVYGVRYLHSGCAKEFAERMREIGGGDRPRPGAAATAGGG